MEAQNEFEALRRATETHITLAKKWAQWNGHRGTVKQVAKIVRWTPEESLRRMLADRKVVTP